MELKTLAVKEIWQGREIDRPVNHDMAKYSTPNIGDPMSLVEKIEHVPNEIEDEELLPLAFKITSVIPFNYLGELHYEYFARPRDYKIVEIRETGVVLEFIAEAVCNIVEGNYGELFYYCGVGRQYLKENPDFVDLEEDDRIDMEDEIADNHACGLISDAIVIVHDMNNTALKVQYSDEDIEADLLYDASVKTFAQMSDEDLVKLESHGGCEIDFKETFTTETGEQNRIIVIPHED